MVIVFCFETDLFGMIWWYPHDDAVFMHIQTCKGWYPNSILVSNNGTDCSNKKVSVAFLLGHPLQGNK